MPKSLLLAVPAAALIALTACGGPDDTTDRAATPDATVEDSTPVVPADGATPVLPAEPTDEADTTDTASAETGTDCTSISSAGYCNVSFGLTETEVRDAFDGDLSGDMSENTACYYLLPDADEYDVSYMMAEGTMQRVDVRAPGVTTSAGAAVGMPLDEVESLYDGGTRTPNKYEPEIEVLKVDLGDDVYGVFEEDADGNVRAYRYGIEPAVSYVEGCS
ncbi:hypothetical protein WNY37_07930 [Henriciella sp. AS95]|uniref:hypothetical protein n=1 Tax=Henriciella sp. AS95 TaxID=3135782 RepID=UPI00317D806D